MMLTPLGILQATYWPKPLQRQSMLAIALPADDNWKSQPPLRPRQSHPSSSVSAPMTSTSPMANKDSYSHIQPTSTPMASGMSSNGTVIGPGASHSVDTVPSGKPLARSKSRGGSVGGFMHGIVNGMQASLRNVGHKSTQTGTRCGLFLLLPVANGMHVCTIQIISRLAVYQFAWGLAYWDSHDQRVSF